MISEFLPKGRVWTVTGMDFIGLVWKQAWKITLFGLKKDQDKENRAAHIPSKNSQEYPHSPLPPGHKQMDLQLEGDKHLLDFQWFNA